MERRPVGGAKLRAPQVDVGQLELAVGEHGPRAAKQLRHLALRRLVGAARGAQPLVERVAPLGAARPVAPQDHRVAPHVQEAQVLPRVRQQQHRRRRNPLTHHLTRKISHMSVIFSAHEIFYVIQNEAKRMKRKKMIKY